MPFQQPSFVIRRLFWALFLGVFWYVSCFVLMMDWVRPGTYDPARHAWTDASSYYMVDTVRVPGDFTMYAAPVCWANRAFWPIDTTLSRTNVVAVLRGSLSLAALRVLEITPFGLVLAIPVLFSLIANYRDPGRRHRARLASSVLLAIWYVALIALYHLMRWRTVGVLLGKPVAVLGTVLVIAIMVRAGRGTWLSLAVPLAIAILSGTVWLILSL
jgi:hypothetical protein